MPGAAYTFPSWVDKLTVEDAVKLILVGFFGTTAPGASGSSGVGANTFVTNGYNGFIVISDTNPHTGLTANCIKALGGDVVISTAVGDFPAGALDGKTLSNGDFIPGTLTSITLTSGTLIAFNAQ